MSGEKRIAARCETLSQFGVIAFRIDKADGAAPPAADERSSASSDHEPLRLLKAISRLIENLCPESDGVWEIAEPLVFACLLPLADETACVALCQKIRENLTLPASLTLSFGIAVYPYFHFTKPQIVENARKAIDHAAFFGPNSLACFDATTLNISGDKHYQDGDLDGAVAEFKAALAIDPNHLNVHNSLGVCYGRMERTADALREFRAAIAIDAQDSMAHFNSGQIYLALNNREEALKCFLQAAEIKPAAYELLAQLATLLLEENRFQEALGYFLQAEQLKPTSPVFFRNLGKCYEGLGQRSAAISAYKKAVKINPNDAESLSALGYLYDSQGENPEISIVFCQHSVELAPNNGLYHFRLGALYLKQRKLSDALAEFTLACRLGHNAAGDLEMIKSMMNQEVTTI